MTKRSLSDRIFAPFENWVDTYLPYDEAAIPPRGFFRFLWQYISPFRLPVAIAALITVVVAFAEVGLIYYLGRVIDLLGKTPPDQFWQAHGREMLVALCVILIVLPALQSLGALVMKNGVQPNLAALGRWRAHRHVLRQPVGWFENDFAGRIASRVTSLPATTGEFVLTTTQGAGFISIYFVAAFVLMTSTEPVLVIPLAIWFILYVLLLWRCLPRVRKASRKSSGARSRTLGFVVDAYSNIQSVKLFDHSPHEAEVAKQTLEHHRKTYAAENRIFVGMDVRQLFLNGFLTVSVTGWALYLWSSGNITLGAVAAAGTLALRINGMTGRIMFMLMNLFRMVGVMNEGMETVAQPVSMVDRADAREFAFERGRIEVQALSHHYGRGAGGLDNLTLTIEPGERVGLVGRSGAGKTTLVKCLLRLMDPETGRVLVDGQDVSAVTQSSLRREIGVVQQDSALLHRSIRDNIRYGRPDASDQDIQHAAERALAQGFIPTLEDSFGNSGYDAQVGERGVKLSGGQRQRISLARVILKDAPILVLDEATSALDSAAEAQVQEALYGMMEGKTVLAIAHRLSTIAQMDRIVVLDEGKIAEQGTHDELLASDGLYAQLWRYQSGGYLQG